MSGGILDRFIEVHRRWTNPRPEQDKDWVTVGSFSWGNVPGMREWLAKEKAWRGDAAEFRIVHVTRTLAEIDVDTQRG